MYQWRFIRLLLSPSIFSGLFTTGISCSFLAYFSWQYIQDNKFFYDYLFGMYGVRNYVGQQSQDGISARIQDFFSGDIAYAIIVAAVAVVIGAVVYMLLTGASLIKKRAAELTGELQYSGEQRSDLIAELITRLALRIMSVLGWGLYAAFFSSSIVQLALLLTEQGITHLQDGSFVGGLQVLLAITALTAGLHIHVLFLRLCFLRVRVFGGDEQIEEIELDSHLH